MSPVQATDPSAPDTTTANLWASAADVYQRVVEHPFLAGLADGTLPEAAFRYYVVQDALYLHEYARALSVCAARAPEPDDVAMFDEHAAGAIAVERALHAGFLEEFGLTEHQVRAAPMSPTTQAYTSYLLAATHGGSFAEGLAAVLPCYWIYAEVGRHLGTLGSPEPRYQRWIDTYQGEAFQEVVRSVLDLTDRVGVTSSPLEQERMRTRFRATSRYEWMFWDAAWRQEQWPV